MDNLEPAWKLEERERTYFVALSGVINRELVDRFHQEVRRMAASAKDVVIECSAAEYLDACILQELLALRAALEAKGKVLRCTGNNPSIRRYIQIAGLAEYLPWSAEAPA